MRLPWHTSCCSGDKACVQRQRRGNRMADLILRQSELDIAPALERESAAQVVAQRVDFRLVDTFDGFEALAPEWNALFARAGRPEHAFQAFAWNWHWARHYLASETGRKGPKLAIVTGWSEGRLVLLLPLALEQRAGLRTLVWMGEPVSQYGDVLAALEAANLETLRAAWQFAVKATRADLANLRKVRADAPAAMLLGDIGTVITATEQAPFVDFRQARSWAAFEAALPSKGRLKNRRRQMRRLAERGPIAFAEHSGSREAGELADYAILLKRAWLGERDRISLALADDRFQAFFRDAASATEHPVPCKVLSIRTNNEVAALQIVIENRGVRFLHVAVYAPKFEKAGAGALLLEHSLQRALEQGVQQLDLLPPLHDYKLDFAERSVDVHDHAIALSLAGRAYASGYLGVRRRLKAVVEAMPAPARRVVVTAVRFMKRCRG